MQHTLLLGRLALMIKLTFHLDIGVGVRMCMGVGMGISSGAGFGMEGSAWELMERPWKARRGSWHATTMEST